MQLKLNWDQFKIDGHTLGCFMQYPQQAQRKYLLSTHTEKQEGNLNVKLQKITRHKEKSNGGNKGQTNYKEYRKQIMK